MSCYKPLYAYRSFEKNPSGKFRIVFSQAKAFAPKPMLLPCGRCIGCRIDRSRQWAVRCVHEASLYERNCFITLTFNDDNLDKSGSLVKRDFVLFIKRLRKRFGPGVRFFHCGEYGELNSRPHHHACLFNFDFPDKVLWSVRSGVRLYRSKILDELWPFGFCTVGDVTFESAAYVSRYILKKIVGKDAESHYVGRVPEYITMSRGCKKLGTGGIGKGWFNKFSTDIYPHDFVVMKGGKTLKPPRFYDNIYDLTNPGDFAKIKLAREVKARSCVDNSFARLNVRRVIQEDKVKLLRREL